MIEDLRYEELKSMSAKDARHTAIRRNLGAYRCASAQDLFLKIWEAAYNGGLSLYAIVDLNSSQEKYNELDDLLEARGFRVSKQSYRPGAFVYSISW